MPPSWPSSRSSPKSNCKWAISGGDFSTHRQAAHATAEIGEAAERIAVAVIRPVIVTRPALAIFAAGRETAITRGNGVTGWASWNRFRRAGRRAAQHGRGRQNGAAGRGSRRWFGRVSASTVIGSANPHVRVILCMWVLLWSLCRSQPKAFCGLARTRRAKEPEDGESSLRRVCPAVSTTPSALRLRWSGPHDSCMARMSLLGKPQLGRRRETAALRAALAHLRCMPSGSGCSRKNRTISPVASGPRGRV